MAKKPGCFDPWRMEPTPEADPATKKNHVDLEAPQAAPVVDAPFILKGRRCGITVGITVGDPDPNGEAVYRLISILLHVKPEICKKYGITQIHPGHNAIILRDEQDVFYVDVDGIDVKEAALVAMDRMANALMDAEEDPAFGVHLTTLKITPWRRA